MISRQKLTLPFDEPALVTLEQPRGRECSSQYNGTEWRYNVLRGEQPVFLYLPRQGHEAIQQLAPRAGDVVELLRMKRGDREVYDARYPDSAPRSVRVVAPAAYQPNYENDTHAPARSPHQNDYRNGANNGQSKRGSSHLAQCLVRAIDDVVEAQEYAREKGLSIQFTGADIQDIAVTYYINDQRNGGGN